MAGRSHVSALEVSFSAYARALVTYLDLPDHLKMNCLHENEGSSFSKRALKNQTHEVGLLKFPKKGQL